MDKKLVDNKDRKLLLALQKGIPIATRPYKDMADAISISEDELILRLKKLKEIGLVKRIDFRMNLKRIGLTSALVACKIPKEEIPKAKKIILNCNNITHNYLRKHELNMWFTLSASSFYKLSAILTGLKRRLKTDKIIHLKTAKIFKLGFRLNVK